MVSGPTVSTEAEPVDDDLSEVLWLLWLLYAPGLLPPWPPPKVGNRVEGFEILEYMELQGDQGACS